MRPCQIEVIEHENERPYLKYTEDVSKNRPGGLKGKNVKPKIVYHKVPRIDEHLAVAEVQDQLQVYESVSSPIRQDNQLTSSHRANYNSKQLDCQTVRPAQSLN